MKLGIMQPYFFPYLGYFQLLNCVDKLVLYDNIEFTKKGWINKNRLLLNGKESLFSINLKKDSDYLNICERSISPVYKKEREKLIRKIESSYKKAPCYAEVMPLIRKIIEADIENLFDYILNSIVEINTYLNIKTPLVISSSLNISNDLKGQDKVIAICNKIKPSEYVNPVGGMELYSKITFKKNGLDLSFIEMNSIEYFQGSDSFVSHLSIIDVLMWNKKEKVICFLNEYKLI